MAKSWTVEEIDQLTRGFQGACVVVAAAELDLFGALTGGPLAAAELADKLASDPRATAVLADALAALDLLDKRDGRYALAPGVADALTADGARTRLHMTRHLGNCLRRWAQLAEVVRSGRPAPRRPSVLGPAGDTASFIGGMHEINEAAAPNLVAALGPPAFGHLLDVGGASGTWTIAFLRAVPGATATFFDLPDVMPLARRRLAAAGLADRVRLVAGDLYTDELPCGADLAWVSAIIHMNSREQNRELYAKVHAALADAGRILIRDVVMEVDRTRPAGGALFAVNMLVATEGGGTFTFEEIRDDLQSAGFTDVHRARTDQMMSSVVEATKA